MKKRIRFLTAAFAVVMAVVAATLAPVSAQLADGTTAEWVGELYRLDWTDGGGTGPYDVTVDGVVVADDVTTTTYDIAQTAMTPGTPVAFEVVDTVTAVVLMNDSVTADVAGAPTSVTATASASSIVVTWGAPAELGTPAATSYEVQLFSGDESLATVQIADLTHTFSDLEDGTYRVEVAAQNGPDSTWLSAVASDTATIDTTTVPGTVTSVQVVRDGDQITVAWSPPTDNGDSAITGYVVSRNGSETSLDAASTDITYDGLSADTYNITIAAINAKGSGPTVPVVVNNLPPANVDAAQPENGVAETTITWDAPPGNPTSYEVTIAGLVEPVTSPSLTIELAPGTHRAEVVAINSQGRSLPGTSNDITITVAPDGPASVDLDADDLELTVSWDPPADTGGSALDAYVVTLIGPAGSDCDPDRTAAQLTSAGCVVTQAAATARSVTFNVDEPGQYTVSVAARTEAGLASATVSSPAEARRAFQPFGSKAAYVEQLYRDILGRNADSAGRDYWVGQIDSEADAPAIAQAFMSSQEFGPRRPIARMYLAYLNRAPDQSGFDYWTPLLVTGQAELIDISWGFAASEEFAQRYGELSDGEFIALVYIYVLGRELDQEGYVYWFGELARGLNRAEMMLYFSESEEFVNKTKNFVDVTLAYRGMLDRSPTDAEIASLIYRMSRGTTFDQVIAEIFDSAEYAERITP